MAALKRPLEGIRILAVEQYGAGPYGTQLMSELGAEVIKIEAPSMGGDVSRATGPYFLGEGDSQFFQTFSRGKKSVSLEIKSPEGRAAFERLVASADAVVNNVRGDQPEKLRITYDHLKAINPKIVCAHLSAYGRDNSRATWPGYDYLMQAEAGFMTMTGEPDGPPVRFGLSMVDFMTGSMFAFSIVSALLSAKTTGEGCDVDVSLFDVALHQTSYPAVWSMNEGHDVGRLPRGAHPSIAPSQMVRTKDGWAMLLCQTPKFWDVFCELAQAPHLKADPRFVDIPSRRKHVAELTEALDAVFAKHTTDEWMALLGGKAPFAPVKDLKDALANPYVAEIAMRDVVEHPDRPEGLHMLASPIKVNGKRAPGVRAPKMGEHNDELLGGE
ncbi:MAG: CoA transferase [Pseudomonadota bacterium]|uniref:CaiB/BaiF CoA transferase family protein n=1 Tax=unclassified Phenylobacterium TaxID=2640670 RepID=UPI0006F3042A|nr:MULTISPECIES: CoA transferase [unclassified Phenylobacterium]KRB40154.1 CoA-transferase [Phenylobacterium sp. Root700]MBT9469817.1 CoA transferase [Phenylobacterium sp.]